MGSAWAPHGPRMGPAWAPHGPAWARMGPHGPAWARMGPAWARMGPHGPRMGPHGLRMGPLPGWPSVGMGPDGPALKTKNQKNTNASCRFARVCQCRKEVVHLRIVLFTWPHIESVGIHTAMTGLAGAAAFASVSEGSAPACCPSCCSWSFCSSCCPALTHAAMYSHD